MEQYNVLIPPSDEDSPFGDLPLSTSLDASAKLMATNDLVSLSKNFEKAITRHILFSFPSSFEAPAWIKKKIALYVFKTVGNMITVFPPTVAAADEEEGTYRAMAAL
jgi:hypothetical protein